MTEGGEREGEGEGVRNKEEKREKITNDSRRERQKKMVQVSRSTNGQRETGK
jgi:hypothetical protein